VWELSDHSVCVCCCILCVLLYTVRIVVYCACCCILCVLCVLLYTVRTVVYCAYCCILCVLLYTVRTVVYCAYCCREGCRFVGRTCSEIRQHNEQHLKEFFTTGKFKCLLCSFANSHRVALQIHSVVHQGAAPFTCNVCGSGPFSSIKKLNLHIQSHTGENKFSCSHVNCSYTSNHSSNMNRHYRLKHNGVIPICQGTLSPSRYRCASCEFCSESEVIVAIHSIVHKKTPPYSCWACGKGGFLTPDSINWHTNTHLKDGSLALLPSYQFDDGATSAVGSSEEAVQPFTSANVDGVKQNLLELPPAQKRMKCLLCKFSTNQKLGMEIHSTVHKDLPPFQCSYCKEKGFKTNKQLAFHIQTHTGEAKYTCTYKECFYTSNHSSNMNRHYRLRHDHEHCTPSHCASSKSTICPANKHKQQFDSPPFSLVPELPAQEEPEPAVDSLETSAQTPAQTPTVNLDLSGADLTEKRYYCGECDFSTDGDRQWRLHQLKHLPRYHCTLCAFSSLANDVMKRHYRSVHKRPPPVFLTTTAPKETAKTTAESRHLKCNLCNFRTSYSDELTRHVQQMHVIKKCAMCNYMTVDKRQYNLHVEVLYHLLYTYSAPLHLLYTSTLTIHLLYTYSALTLHLLYTSTLYSALTLHLLYTSTLTLHLLYTYSTPNLHLLYTYSMYSTLTLYTLHLLYTYYSILVYLLYTYSTFTLYLLYTILSTYSTLYPALTLHLF